MRYLKSEMLYDNDVYYKWKATDDHDNPYYRSGADLTLLNRTEGYEVLYFINHLGSKHCNYSPSTNTYHRIEKLIRYDEPANIRSHKGVADWIVANWSKA